MGESLQGMKLGITGVLAAIWVVAPPCLVDVGSGRVGAVRFKLDDRD
jgi:hypothetical protein